MQRGPRINYLLRLGLDALLLTSCFWVATQLLHKDSPLCDSTTCVELLLFNFLIWYLSARIFHFYTSITLFSFSQELTLLVRVIALHALIFVFVLALFLPNFYLYRSQIFFFYFFLLILFPFVKYFYRVTVAYIRSHYQYVRKILVVGELGPGAQLYRSGMLINNLRYTIVGFVGESAQSILGVNRLGGLSDLTQIFESYSVDEVFLMLPHTQSAEIAFVIDQCERAQIQVNVVNDFNRLGAAPYRLSTYAGFPVVGLRYFPLDDPENRFFKRSFDIIFSSLFIVLIFSWLAPILALLIKLDSKGPVFFKQDRWGLNNKRITCYKFRTMFAGMSSNSQEEAYPQTKTNDSRITSLGKFLRKTSIDELPQFINVLLGDMSVVGPRPHPIPLSLESKDLVQHYMHRHLVKPGITGWAQVSGSRGAIRSTDEMTKRVAFDLWYIENWSFWLDCQIIFQTIINLIKGDENAY